MGYFPGGATISQTVRIHVPDRMKADRITNIFISLGIIFCVSVIVYGLLIHDKLRWFGASGIIFFYGVPVGGMVMLGLLFRLRPAYKINLVISSLAMIGSLYLGEGLLTLMTSPPSRRVNFDKRSYVQVLLDLRAAGQPATVTIAPGFFTSAAKLGAPSQPILPLGGVANSLVVLCNEVGEWIVYQSDEHGFHNPSGLYQQSSLDIVGIGDSFAIGMCVKPERNLFSLLRQSYPRTLNLGMGLNGPLAELADLREYAAPLRPKRVLWLYYEGNDLADLQREQSDESFMQYLQPGYTQNLLARQAEIQPLLAAYAEAGIERMKAAEAARQAEANPATVSDFLWYLRKHPLFKFLTLNQLLGRLGLFPMPTSDLEQNAPAANLELFRQILQTAHREVNSWGGKFYFVYLCQKTRFARFGQPNPYRSQVLDIVRDEGLPVLDTYELFRRQQNPLALFQGHYTEQGYALLAEAILDMIQE